MDFVPGAPLSQLREELKRRGIEIEPGSLAEQERPPGSPDFTGAAVEAM
jgi:hypothetical protein